MSCYWDDSFDAVLASKWETIPGYGTLAASSGRLKNMNSGYSAGEITSLGYLYGDFSVTVEGYLPLTFQHNDDVFLAADSGGIGFWRSSIDASRVYLDPTQTRIDTLYPGESFVNVRMRIVRSGSDVNVYWYAPSTGWVLYYTTASLYSTTNVKLYITRKTDSLNEMYLDNLVYDSGCPVPSIISLSKTHGAVGSIVTITGVNFHTTLASNTVKFNGTSASILSGSALQLVVLVPVGATSGTITVENIYGTCTSADTFYIDKISRMIMVL